LAVDNRDALGRRYCPDAATTRFTAWRTWQNGEERISGRAKAYPPFEHVRSHAKAAERRAAYDEIRQAYGLPGWTNSDAAEAVMVGWELEHPDQLEDAEVSDTHFFGIQTS